MINIALTNLGKYNEGELVFEWLRLPATKQEIAQAMISVGIDGEEYEEYFITDSECDLPIEVGEYTNLDYLNKIAETLEDIKDIKKLGYLMDEGIISESDLFHKDSFEINNELDDYKVVKLSDDSTSVEYELAVEYIENVVGGMENLSTDELLHYFDFKRFGADLISGGAVVSLVNNVVLV